MTGIAVAMYDQSWWPELRTALTKAYAGDGSALLTMADVYNNRVGGHFQSNETEANFAHCLDAQIAARDFPGRASLFDSHRQGDHGRGEPAVRHTGQHRDQWISPGAIRTDAIGSTQAERWVARSSAVSRPPRRRSAATMAAAVAPR